MELKDDADECRSNVSYTLTFADNRDVQKLCGFQYRFPTGFANIRLVRRAAALAIVPSPLIIVWKVGRSVRPYTSKLQVIVTSFQVVPARSVLETGTDLETSVSIDHIVERDAKSSLLAWVQRANQLGKECSFSSQGGLFWMKFCVELMLG
eukprot:CAMPEP_0205895630 /NCGR_PEP_ID=MMETSP1083-20121108/24505_1 /ASSEMBLY_ACC=CAM_ASM_000430 /TAXON_ID=97485 /ORGANISM="Prymnesium parvum, Strain Texoma1" /LENGTH=150 /DNA_ID=CAMNT_0053260613 /DNA_START=241 /DNA_END=690 /DNA_ORIENTATION=-